MAASKEGRHHLRAFGTDSQERLSSSAVTARSGPCLLENECYVESITGRALATLPKGREPGYSSTRSSSVFRPPDFWISHWTAVMGLKTNSEHRK